ncbi:lamin Dm0 [Caerostris extrusa]|uniref:Lamin Dm0 n=1 Tax=Caerostris extrusa TaxID=172846 RepID=A0AAV4QXZ6_CAEEX|nr:lamin Dm0 [Caerostris extrusa]
MSRRTLNISQVRSPSPQVGSSSSDRRRSNLSPTRITRIQEKADLQNLNDRLAIYIDTVRNLEQENSRLSTLIRTTQETTTKEVTNVKNCYEKELGEVRKVLDITAKEKAKLQLEADKWKNEADDLRIKKRVSHLSAENRRLENQLRDALADNDDLSKQLSNLKKKLDEETLSRVDLENRLQSAKEELSFKESIYQREITETRHLKETEISELNNQLAENYEQKLADKTIYETKIADLQKKLDRNADFSNSYREELRTLKSKVDNLSSRNSTLESSNTSLLNRIKDLEKMLEQEREWHNDALNAKEEELRTLRNEMEQQLAEYRELLDIKVALDMEIAAYRKLLEGEEIRLNISPSSSRASSPLPTRSTPVRSHKRRRILTDSERTSSGVQSSAKSSGDIDVADHDMLGKFVKIHNKGKQEISLGSWQLVQKGEGAEVTYKFPRATVIKPNANYYSLSSNSGIQASPPQTLVMKISLGVRHLLFDYPSEQ